MNINFDYSSADEALRLLTKIQRSDKVSFKDWSSLFKTGGYKSLVENKAFRRKDLKSYLIRAARGDLPGAALLQENVEDLSVQSEKMGLITGNSLKEWLPESLNFEHFTLSHALYGGKAEPFDPAVIDISYAASLKAEEREKLYSKLSLTLLMRRYQNLERFYLKNFIAIRRYMPFIYALWECQIEGIHSLMQENTVGSSADERPETVTLADEIFSRAARADKTELEKEGYAFKKQVKSKILGPYMYDYLFTQQGKEGIKESLDSPLAIFQLIAEEQKGERIFSPEALFFISQLQSLLA